MNAFRIFQCALIVNIVLIANAARNICPPTVLIFPCRCVYSTIECSGFRDHEDLEDIFRESINLENPVLRILNSDMLFIPHTIFEMTQFREIYVANSNFTSLFNDTPSSETLKKFIIDNCYFDLRIKGEMFANLTIDSLEFVNNGMTSLRKYLTDGLPNTLTKLSFREPRLHNVSVDFLENVNNLQELSIQHGNLRRLNKIIFPKTIRIINLRNNKIEYIPNGIFDNLPNLTAVILEKNLLTTLNKEVFASVPRLFLLNNPIICNCKLKWLVEPNNKTEVVNGKCDSPFGFKGTEINKLNNLYFTSCFWKT